MSVLFHQQTHEQKMLITKRMCLEFHVCITMTFLFFLFENLDRKCTFQFYLIISFIYFFEVWPWSLCISLWDSTFNVFISRNNSEAMVMNPPEVPKQKEKQGFFRAIKKKKKKSQPVRMSHSFIYSLNFSFSTVKKGIKCSKEIVML